MKNLNTYINEGMHFKLTRDYKKPYNYHPEDIDELEKIIKELIKERGIEADLNDINVSNIISMRSLFLHSKFDGNISKWDVSNVEDMQFMFYKSNFTGKNGDISKWDVHNVENMKDMFKDSPLDGNEPAWYKE